MIKIFLTIVFCAIAFWFIVGRKIAKNLRTAGEKKFKQEQQRAAWRDGYQKEKVKIAFEQGRKAAQDEIAQPTLDLRQIDSSHKAADVKKTIAEATEKKPICIEHNFTGKNWLDYARHIRKYHKKK